jgi:hypothetical protein
MWIESERFKPFTYAYLLQRDKVSLDLVWLRENRSKAPRTCCLQTSSPRRSSRISSTGPG